MSNKYINSSVINQKIEDEEEKKKEKETSSTPKTMTATTSETSDQSSLKNKSAAEVISDLKAIEKAYSQKDYIDAPESLGLEKVDVPNKTDEELISLAKSSVSQKYGDKKTSTNENFSKQIEKLLESKETLSKNADTKKNEINNIYNESIKETENQMLKRGLARSSIVIGELSNLEGAKASELANVLNELETNLNNAEKSIADLETQKEQALASLDIEYALELEEEIEKVKSEYQEARNEAIKFNNNVEKIEAEYKLDLDKQKLDKQESVTKLENEYGVNYTYQTMKSKQFDYLKEYLSSLEPSYAINLFLTNKDFYSILGDRYSEMYQYLKSR